MSISDVVVAPVAEALLACLATEMAQTPVPPGSVCLRWGQQVALLLSESYDECCGGLAWVRFARQLPSGQARFPAADAATTPCDVIRWALEFELGTARCATTVDANTVPTCDQHLADSVTMFDDLAAIRRALCRYQRENKPGRRILVGEGIPGDTEGGCMSVTVRATISTLSCDPGCKGAVVP